MDIAFPEFFWCATITQTAAGRVNPGTTGTGRSLWPGTCGNNTKPDKINPTV
ncbi:hypothetical protein KRR40_46110 [Niabella defluvii]|nr:hypothetical protein KRR40_46110 [Niabella sp. I65]